MPSPDVSQPSPHPPVPPGCAPDPGHRHDAGAEQDAGTAGTLWVETVVLQNTWR